MEIASMVNPRGRGLVTRRGPTPYGGCVRDEEKESGGWLAQILCRQPS